MENQKRDIVSPATDSIKVMPAGGLHHAVATWNRKRLPLPYRTHPPVQAIPESWYRQSP